MVRSTCSRPLLAPRGLVLSLLLLLAAQSFVAPSFVAQSFAAEPSPAEPSPAEPSAPELIQRVYDEMKWLAAADTFYIRTHTKITTTEEGRAWRKKYPAGRGIGFTVSSDEKDGKPFFYEETMAWDRRRICKRSRSWYEGEEAAAYRYIHVWDGAQGVWWHESATEPVKNYAHATRLSDHLRHSGLEYMQLFPWRALSYRELWWHQPTADDYWLSRGLAKDDFELVRRPLYPAQSHTIVESRVAHRRIHLDADGRIRQQIDMAPSQKWNRLHHLDVAKRASGQDFDTPKQYQSWFEKQSPEERRRIDREIEKIRHPFSLVTRVNTLEDYREIAPGCWLPFQQVEDSYEWDDLKRILDSRYEKVVEEVAVNRPLDEALFQYELPAGAQAVEAK